MPVARIGALTGSFYRLMDDMESAMEIDFEDYYTDSKSIYDRALARCREEVYAEQDIQRKANRWVRRRKELEDELASERALSHPRPDVLVDIMARLADFWEELRLDCLKDAGNDSEVKRDFSLKMAETVAAIAVEDKARADEMRKRAEERRAAREAKKAAETTETP